MSNNTQGGDDEDIAAVLLDAQAVMSSSSAMLLDDSAMEEEDDDDNDDENPFSPNFLVQKLADDRVESPSELYDTALQRDVYHMTPTSYLDQLLQEDMGNDDNTAAAANGNAPPSTPCLDIAELQEESNSGNTDSNATGATEEHTPVETNNDKSVGQNSGRMMSALMESLEEEDIANPPDKYGDNEEDDDLHDMALFSDSHGAEEEDINDRNVTAEFETLMNQTSAGGSSLLNDDVVSTHSGTGFDSLMDASLHEILNGSAHNATSILAAAASATSLSPRPKSHKQAPVPAPKESPGGVLGLFQRSSTTTASASPPPDTNRKDTSSASGSPNTPGGGGVRGLFQRIGGVVENALLTSVVDTFSPNSRANKDSEHSSSSQHNNTQTTIPEGEAVAPDSAMAMLMEEDQPSDLKSIFQNQTRVMNTSDDDDAMSFVTANETTGSPTKERRRKEEEQGQELPLIPTLSKELTPKRSGKNNNGDDDPGANADGSDSPPPSSALLPSMTHDDDDFEDDPRKTPHKQSDVLANPNNTTLLGTNMSPIPFPNQPFIRMSAEVEYGDSKDVGSLSSASTESSRLLRMGSSSQQHHQQQHSRWIKKKHLPASSSSPGSQSSSAVNAKVLFNPLHSIFNKVQHSTSGGPEVSPPGTPPEPVYEYNMDHLDGSGHPDNDDDSTSRRSTNHRQRRLPQQLPQVTWEDVVDASAADDSCSSSQNYRQRQHQSLPYNLSFSSLSNSKQLLQSAANNNNNASKHASASNNSKHRLSFSPNRRGGHSSPTKQNFPEQLVAFSSMPAMELPFRYTKPTVALESVGAILWKQLLARWKHAETVTASSLVSDQIDDDDSDDEWSDESMPEPIRQELELQGLSLAPAASSSALEKASVRYLSTAVASTPLSAPQPQHATDDDATIFQQASSLQIPLKEWMQSVLAFAAYNTTNNSNSAISYSVDLKDAEAVTRKAQDKYDGACKFVKDVVRGQITFPDTSTLVCGLLQAFRTCEKWEVVRIKNSFREDDTVTLPTGYRHVLLTLRWKETGCLAEIQMHRRDMFDVLGDEGYRLHRQVRQMEAAAQHPTSTLVQAILEGNEAVCWMEGVTSPPSISPPEQHSFHSQLSTIDVLDELHESCSQKSQTLSDNAQETHTETPNRSAAETQDVSESQQSLDPASLTENMMSRSASSGLTAKPTREELEQAKAKFRSHMDDLATNYVGKGDISLSLLECAAQEVSKQHRDVASYFCLHLIFAWLGKQQNICRAVGFDVNGSDDLIRYSSRCLLRCLKISNQALSRGMAGWLEYGTSSPLDRSPQRPFAILRQLASNYGVIGEWDDAKSVSGSLVWRAEEQLGSDDPITISAWLDLAVAASKLPNATLLASNTITKAAAQATQFVAGLEKLYWLHLSKCKASKVVTFRIEDGRDAIGKLSAFCASLRSLLNRHMITLAGELHDAVLVNHCLVADAFAILANCKAASTVVTGSTTSGDDWEVAMEHYELAFCRFLKGGKAFNDPHVLRTAYGLARCMRQMGERKKALELLSVVVGCEDPIRAKNEDDVLTQKTSPEPSSAKSFLPPEPKKSKTARRKDETLRASALCLWLMSILSLEESPDESGRNKAFDLLHAASIRLQGTTNRTDCIPFLTMIEDEAVQIAEHAFE